MHQACCSSRLIVALLGAALGSGCFVAPTLAQSPAPEHADVASGAWVLLDHHSDAVESGEAWIRPFGGQALKMDMEAMRTELSRIPLETIPGNTSNGMVIELPNPEGGFSSFRVVESPVMEPALQAKFPQIRTYVGQGIDEPASTIRFDLTPAGFHAQVLGDPDGAWYIDPYTRNDTQHYTAYTRRHLQVRPGFRCLTGTEGFELPEGWQSGQSEFGERDFGGTLRVFRLAVTTTGEYTQFHGGTVAGGLAAVVTSVNRIVGIYETEFSIRMTLVANNDLVIYTNPATDPYTSPGPSGTTMTQAQGRFDALIGSPNYDVGHLYHRAANSGVAGAIGNLCDAGQKGRGVSQTEPPVGDPFSVDYVAHELGHQFGMRHCFNSCGGGPGDAANIAHEPASGQTIMGYAGICGGNDLQPNSDPNFLSINHDQLESYILTRTCDVESPTGNGIPSVNAGPDYTIPARTPYALVATGSDPDGDTLTFQWNQRNGGPAVNLPLTDNGQNPLTRTDPPTLSPVRIVPRIANLLNNTPAVGEITPTTSRTMNFRVIARDNRAGGGATNFDDMVLTVVSHPTGFRVTSPNSSQTWAGFEQRTITWDVANTASAPISTASVDIMLSTDGGQTFPITLAAATPNDGTQTVTIPNTPTTNARIMVRAVGNIFFNINQGGTIQITQTNLGVFVEPNGAPVITDATGNGNGNGRIDPGEASIALRVPVRNAGLSVGGNVLGTLTSLTPTVIVSTSSSIFSTLNPNGGTGQNLAPFVLNVLPSHPCGDPISLRLNWSQGSDAGSFTFALGTGLSGQSIPSTVTYAGPRLILPNGTSNPRVVNLPVAGVPGTISDVDFSFDGTSCSNQPGSQTVGLSHTRISDLIITLRNPAGTDVILSGQDGGAGVNLCNTVFDDEAAQAFATATGNQAPFTGSWRPDQSLGAFDGPSPNGTWQLRIADPIGGANTGSVAFFSLRLTTQTPAACQPPLGGVCDDVDFNNDGIENDPTDIEAFLSVYSGGACIPGSATCNDIDFNNDGIDNDPTDIESFLSVYSGGPCL